jgi:hypothetical protein
MLLNINNINGKIIATLPKGLSAIELSFILSTVRYESSYTSRGGKTVLVLSDAKGTEFETASQKRIKKYKASSNS